MPVLLLHCYPYERQAGYLAQAFGNVHLDVGLAINYLGAAARALVARSYELAPFAKVLYSSDAWGPAELHYLGARLWRNAVGPSSATGWTATSGRWRMHAAWTPVRLGNARRVYDLD